MSHDIETSTDGGVTAAVPTGDTPTRDAGDESLAADDLLCGADSDVDPTLSVVMPTLDEEEGIAECIDRVKTAVEELQMPAEIVVSDSSSDRTPEIAREMGAIVIEPTGAGYGYAYRYAFERARGDYLVMGDADTTYDFEEIPRFLDILREEDADVVMGSRLDGEILPGSMPALHQYVGNPLLTRFLNAFYGAGVSDAHSGFRLFTREAYERLDLQSDGMEFASEMIMDAGEKDLAIAETPITYHEREGDATLHSFRDGWRHVRFMLVNAPGSLYTGSASVIGLLGVVSFLLSFANVAVGPVTFGSHTAILGSLLVITGYLVGGLSVFSALATDPIREPDGPIVRWMTDHFRLEHGAVTGLGAFGIGIAYYGVAGVGWLAGGAAPPLVTAISAMTVVVLGIQTVFLSFFLSTLAQYSHGT